jgi:protein TonB
VVGDVFVQAVQPPPPSVTGATISTTIDLDRFGRPGGTVFEPTLLDQIPQPRFRTPPIYPFDMRRQGIEGEVMVDFLVDAEGNVLNAHAAGSSHREFDSAAVQAVAKWKFRPGRKDGQNVTTHMQVPIVFSLDQK